MSVPTDTRCNTCGRPVNTEDRFCGFCGARLDGENPTPTSDTTGEHRPHVDRILTSLRAATIGEYDIAGELGRGGMAVVFLAHDLSLNRKVAIKALLPELLYTEGMDRRFKHEARIAAKLDHPNILVIHGVREANDLLFIVMKLVEGLPLSTILKVAGPLPFPVVRAIVRHVADALSYAHGESVVHRDVKPANIMVDRRGNVVVMDFGIAKAADDAHLTRTGLVIGTPAYMSPEQCLAQTVTSASDQYSLGVVAYELLAGRTPFRGSALEMQWAHATAAPPPVRSVRADCPADLEAVVMRMLAKAPGDRWPTLSDVSHALADEPSVASAARASLVALVADVPGRRDPMMPTTPASPLPMGPGPAAIGDATTDPVPATTAGVDPRSVAPTVVAGSKPNVGPVAAPAAAPMLTLSRQRIELSTGDAVELVVELDADDQATDGSSVQWLTSDARVATVSQDGFVTAVGPGLAEITCLWRGRTAICLVQVNPAAIMVLPAAPKPPAARADVAIPEPVAALGTAQASAAAPATVPDAAPPTPERKPELVVTGRRARRGWIIGVVAAGVVGILIYRAVTPSTVVATLPPDAATSPATPASPTPPPNASGSPGSVSPPSSPASVTPEPAPGTARAAGTTASATTAERRVVKSADSASKTARTNVGGSSTAKAPAAAPKVAASSSPTPSVAGQTPPGTSPVIPPVVARADSLRLTTRVDTGSGYGASRATPPTTAAAVPAPAPAASTAKDSTAERIPPAPKEIASALFKEFATAINARGYSRITGAYPQPSDPDGAKLWQEFLVFVRDYTPRATVRSTSVNESSTPPTITATIDFRWSSDAGFDRVRSGSFVGIGVPIPGGWQLRGVKLAKKFW